MYKKVNYSKSTMQSIEKLEGEPIESKIERIMQNKEPIKDGAPEIYTERKDGVIAAYNIKTDRFEIACEAMDKVTGSIQAKREEKPKVEEKDVKVIKIGEAEPTQGKQGENNA